MKPEVANWFYCSIADLERILLDENMVNTAELLYDLKFTLASELRSIDVSTVANKMKIKKPFAEKIH